MPDNRARRCGPAVHAADEEVTHELTVQTITAQPPTTRDQTS